MKNSLLFKLAIAKGFQIAFYDIEMSPNLGYTYEIHDVSIGTNQILVPSQVTSISYLFEGDEDIVVRGWDQSKNKHGKFDIFKSDRDKHLLKTTVPILNEADLLIGQNSISFDAKKIQWRLNVLKLPALNNVLALDILNQSRKAFSPLSHKLDYRSFVYGLGGKIVRTMNDFIQVALGNKKAQKEHMKYNAKDVLDTREVFWKELDYYTLPTSLIDTLKMYINHEHPTFCIRCSARRRAKFNVLKTKSKKGYNFKCKNCDYKWRIHND